jgi:competence protein ComEA
MTISRFFAATALLAFAFLPAFAAAVPSSRISSPTASATAPILMAEAAAKKAPKGAPKKEPITTKVNLNTADAKELDKLPQIGPARAKAIIDGRTKGGAYKDWDDFVARKVIPANAQKAIKDLVTFS